MYLVSDVNVNEDKYVFYVLNNKEYIEFLKKEGEVKKRDYLKYSFAISPSAKIYYSFKDLFKAIDSENLTILDTYEFV